MNRVLCVSHYSPTLNNVSNKWIIDFYKDLGNYPVIRHVDFLNIKFNIFFKANIRKIPIDQYISEIQLSLPYIFRLFRKNKLGNTIFEIYVLRKNK